MQFYKLLSGCLVLAVAVTSCQSSGKETIDRTLLPDSSKMATAPANTTAAPVASMPMQPQTMPGNILPNQPQQPNTMSAEAIQQLMNQQATATAQPQQQAQPQTVAPGMNPPHGQPNHRCDIAVGAPLNSPVAKTTAATTTAPQTVTMSQPTPAKTVTAPGMNPPHGEPNHRCDIAVGAPLNSPVKKVETTPVAVPNGATGAKSLDSAKS